MKYLAYSRKSSAGERQQANSLETQKREILDCVNKNHLNLIEIMSEAKSAADDGNRPVFTKMLKIFKSGEAEGLIVAHIDRISRNLIESGIISKYFKAGYIKEIRTPDRVYTSAEDIIDFEGKSLDAAKYSKTLSLKVKGGQKTKFLKGEYNGKLLGYINQNGKLIIDPEKSQLIKSVFALYNTGEYSLSKLTEKMFKSGLRTTGGKKVYRSVIHRILRNKAYMGIISFNGESRVGIHTPLVTKAEFDMAQMRLEGNYLGKAKKLHFPYRGYLVCATCGCKYTATIKKTKYGYYYCTNGKGSCSQHCKYLPTARVETLLYETLTPFSLREDLATTSLELYTQGLKNNATIVNNNRLRLETQLKSIDGKIERLARLMISSDSNQDLYSKMMKELETSKQDIEIQLKTNQDVDPDLTLELVKKFRLSLLDLPFMFKYGNEDVKEDLLKSLLWNCKVENGKISSVRYKLPYSYLINLNKTDDISIWRR